MTKNRITDLNDHLFAQLERLSDEDLTPEQLEKETKRTGALVAVSEQLIKSAAVSLGAAKLVAEHGKARLVDTLPPLLEGKATGALDK